MKCRVKIIGKFDFGKDLKKQNSSYLLLNDGAYNNGLK